MAWLAEWIGVFVVSVLLGRLLNVRPRITRRKDGLAATTAPHVMVLALGLRLRTVLIDPHQRAVRIFARNGWLFTRVRYIPFDVVVVVLYGYSDMTLFRLPIGSYTELDLFAVGLRLRNGEEVELCRFFGQGDWVNNSWTQDWADSGEEFVAELGRGSQENESRVYAEAVAQMIGAPLERP
jgi:hypothetical protein